MRFVELKLLGLMICIIILPSSQRVQSRFKFMDLIYNDVDISVKFAQFRIGLVI